VTDGSPDAWDFEGGYQPEPLDTDDYATRLQQQYGRLVDNGCFLRPHIRFPLDEAEFRSALDRIVDERDIEFNHIDRAINFGLRGPFDWGAISLSTLVRQSLFFNEYVPTTEREAGDEIEVDTSLYAGSSDPETALEHYADDPDPPKLSAESDNLRRQGYVTLLRDMSPECREATLTMKRVVDEFPQFVWGGELTLQRVGNPQVYQFTTTVYYRPCEF
jgi:hypothetical protein